MNLMTLAQDTAAKIETATAAGQLAAALHIYRALEEAVRDERRKTEMLAHRIVTSAKPIVAD